MKAKMISVSQQLVSGRPFAVAIFIAMLAITSCQDDADKNVDEPNGNKSEVAILEETLGVTFFTRDITVTDKTKENSVVLRVAALNEEFLNDYLNSRKFSIVPIGTKRVLKDKPVQTMTNDNEVQETDKAELESVILTEIVEQKLKPGVVGVGFRHEPDPAYKNVNGRNKYINNNVRYYSSHWPEVLALQAYGQVTFSIQRRSKWYSGWSTIFNTATWCCYERYEFDIDGPFQVRLDISFDYESDFYYEWFNY